MGAQAEDTVPKEGTQRRDAMNSRGRTALALGATMMTLLCSGPVGAQEEALRVAATASADSVCLTADTASEVVELRVFRDGGLRHSTPGTKQTCFIEEDVAEGTHRYDVEAVYRDGTVGSGFAEARLLRPAVRLSNLAIQGSHVTAGGELVLAGEYLGNILRIELDLSALDSGYHPGHENVELGMGRFLVRYRLSSNNTRTVGDYPTRLRVYDPVGRLAVDRIVEVTYLPEGRSGLRFPTGSLVAKPLVEDPNPYPGLEIRGVERVRATTPGRSNLPRLFDQGHLPATADALRVVYSVPTPAGNGGATRLEIGDANASGLFRIPVETPAYAASECTEVCTYELLIPFENEPGASQNLQVQLASYDQGWHHSGARGLAWSLECDADSGTPEPYCIDPTNMVVQGHITYRQRELITHATDFSHSNEPHYRWTDFADATMPAADILVKIADGCGRVTETFTDEDGDYSKQFITFCPEETVTIRAYSFGAPIQGQDVALGLWTAEDKPAPTEIGDITRDSADYTVVSGVVGSFVPDTDYPFGAGTGLTLDRHFGRTETGPLFAAGKFSRSGEMARALGIMRSIRRAQAYQGELIDAGKLDRINVVLTDLPLQGANNTAFFLQNHPRLVYIPPRGEYSPFAAWHEMFHYFDEQTLGPLGDDPGDVGYGRWGEPLANTRAAMLLGSSFMPVFDDVPAENLDYNWNIVSGVPQAPTAVEPGDAWSQGWIWRVAWDLADGTAAEPMSFGGGTGYDDWDGWFGNSSDPNNSKLHRVVLDYFPRIDSFVVDADFEDRGLAGPDLVDLLDGMVCRYGMSDAETGVLLHDVMSYNYLYDHCQN